MHAKRIADNRSLIAPRVHGIARAFEEYATPSPGDVSIAVDLAFPGCRASVPPGPTWGMEYDREPVFAEGPRRPRDRRLARHRQDDRAGFRRERRQDLHLGAQGRCVRRDGGGADGAGPCGVHFAAAGHLDGGGRQDAGRGNLQARRQARHPRQQCRRGLGRAVRGISRAWLGQGDGPQREVALLPDAGAARRAEEGGEPGASRRR